MKLATKILSMYEAKMTSKKAEKIFNALYNVHGNRVQVGMMDLGKISGPVEKALMDGKSEEEATEILKEMIAKYRTN